MLREITDHRPQEVILLKRYGAYRCYAVFGVGLDDAIQREFTFLDELTGTESRRFSQVECEARRAQQEAAAHVATMVARAPARIGRVVASIDEVTDQERVVLVMSNTQYSAYLSGRGRGRGAPPGRGAGGRGPFVGPQPPPAQGVQVDLGPGVPDPGGDQQMG